MDANRQSSIKIVSFATQNPERQAELREGVKSAMGGRAHEIVFAEDETTACESLHDAEILLGWFLNEPMFRCAPRLRWVHLGIAGVEKSLFPAVIESDVVITNASGIHAPVMAEWTLATLFYISQRLREADDWRRDRQWKTHKEDMTRTRYLLSELSALIVGYGAIGQKTAEMLTAIGVRCEAVATQVRTAAIPLHTSEELPDLVGRFDIVVIIVPYTRETDNLFSREILRKMKPGSILVNLARGKIVDEAALIESLKSGPLSWAALDVYQNEPLPETSPFFDLPNVIMTPHIAGNFPDYTKAVNAGFLRNLKLYLAGQPLENVVDKKRGY